MAKRRRLTLPSDSPETPEGMPAPVLAPPLGLETKAMFPPPRAPIARVAGEVAAAAALTEVTAELETLRREGRVVLRLPLDAIVDDHMLRDRIQPEDDEFESLVDSLRAHGQRTPIDVTDLGNGRYGLISGWRRLTALRRLAAAGDGPGSVLALVRRPETAADAYVAMVEENEVRSGLSYWERARIAARAVEAGVFPTEKIALQRLYSSASRARRSKIGSFLTVYHRLYGVLRFPSALTERTGLALARALEDDPSFAVTLAARLVTAKPESSETEQTLILAALGLSPTAGGDATPDAPDPAPSTAEGGPREAPRARPEPEDLGGGIWLRTDRGRLELSGPGVGPDLVARLRDWLAAGGR